MATNTETNRLVLTGQAERVFVCEVEPGDVNMFDETAEHVVRLSDQRTVIWWSTGSCSGYNRADSTILIKPKH